MAFKSLTLRHKKPLGKAIPGRFCFCNNTLYNTLRPNTPILQHNKAAPYRYEAARIIPSLDRLFSLFSHSAASLPGCGACTASFDILPGGAYNKHRPRFGGVAALYLFTSYGAQVRGFFHALATVKRLTVCGRQKAEYSFLWACWNALASKRLLVTAL